MNETEYFYIRNLQGDITGLLDKDGTVVTEYTYDAWGKLLTTTGTLASTVGVKNPYLYRGYRYDTETGLYYLQSRYYDPEIGRFINADDTSILMAAQGELLGGNLFAYCGNSPVMGSDPSGYYYALAAGEILAIGAIISAVFLVLALKIYIDTMPSYYINGYYFRKWLSERISVAILIPVWVYTTLIKAFYSMAGKSDPHDLEKGMTARQREIFQREIEKYKRGRGMKPNDNIPWKILCALAEIARQSRGR